MQSYCLSKAVILWPGRLVLVLVELQYAYGTGEASTAEAVANYRKLESAALRKKAEEQVWDFVGLKELVFSAL